MWEGRDYRMSIKEGPPWNAPEVWQSKLSQVESRLAAENSNHCTAQKRRLTAGTMLPYLPPRVIVRPRDSRAKTTVRLGKTFRM